MGFTETLIFYGVIGIGVSSAVWLAGERQPAGRRSFSLVTALLFWPLYVPVLLAPGPTEKNAPPQVRESHPADSLAAAIAQVEGELDAALASLDGWAEEALSRQVGRIGELKTSWTMQAERIRELDRLLDASHEQIHELAADHERLRASEQARQDNLQRLHRIRGQAYEDLTSTLARVRELATMIHLAKFTGAPASQAEDLVGQIAAAVEGLSEVSHWQQPHSPAA